MAEVQVTTAIPRGRGGSSCIYTMAGWGVGACPALLAIRIVWLIPITKSYIGLKVSEAILAQLPLAITMIFVTCIWHWGAV